MKSADPSNHPPDRLHSTMPSYPSDPESKARQSGDVTSRTPKLVRWLQVQVVSFSLLSLTEQPSDDQPPLPPRGHEKECLSLQKGHCTHHCSFSPLPLPTQDFEKVRSGTYHFCPSPKIHISLLSHPVTEGHITNNLSN